MFLFIIKETYPKIIPLKYKFNFHSYISFLNGIVLLNLTHELSQINE